jgi:hypothetical protein
MQRAPLLDSAGFYLGIGGFLAVTGGLAVAVGSSVAEGSDSWRNPWFVGGLAAALVGVLFVLWAVVLVIAHGHAAKHISEPASVNLRASPGIDAVRQWASGRAALSLEARDLTYDLATADLATAKRDGNEIHISERVSRFATEARAFVERYDTDGSLQAIFDAGNGDAYLGSRIPRAPDGFDYPSTQLVASYRWLVEHTPQPRDSFPAPAPRRA